ncbi:MAG: 3-dehydroquinate synthase II [Euryarchaeota archaeon]|nr:3-dehydroquinate synthase II [Euryarchaeota archaeon]
MELWLDYREGESIRPADAVVNGGTNPLPKWVTSDDNIREYSLEEGGVIDNQGRAIGAFIQIEDDEGQDAALEFIGLANWLLVDCADWKMIPLENLVAAADGSGTKIAAAIAAIDQLQGATFALQRGVDALILPDDDEVWQVAEQLAAQRLATIGGAEESSATMVMGAPVLQEMEILEIEPGGVGDRVCVDFVQMLEIGEGILAGSSAALFALVHGETITSQFVPPRPFRVNVGPVHSYILMADGSTKYLSELVAGDEVLVVSLEGSRAVGVGRLKIEPRPLLLVRYKSGDVHGQIFLQQAETVRLMSNIEKTVSVTHLEAGMQILGSCGEIGRHIGQAISSDVEEK